MSGVSEEKDEEPQRRNYERETNPVRGSFLVDQQGAKLYLI